MHISRKLNIVFLNIPNYFLLHLKITLPCAHSVTIKILVSMEAVQKSTPSPNWSTSELIAKLTDFVAAHPTPKSQITNPRLLVSLLKK